MIRNPTLTGATLVALLTGAIPTTGCDGVNPIGGGPFDGSGYLHNVGCETSFKINLDDSVDMSAYFVYGDEFKTSYFSGAGEFNTDLITIFDNSRNLENLSEWVVGDYLIDEDIQLNADNFPGGFEERMIGGELTQPMCESGILLGDEMNLVMQEYDGVVLTKGVSVVYIPSNQAWGGAENCKNQDFNVYRPGRCSNLEPIFLSNL